MAGNFGSIKARVARRMVDSTTAFTAEIGDFVNDAFKEVQDRYNFPWMKAVASYTTAVGTRTLGPTPTDYKSWREHPYLLQNTDGTSIPLVMVRSQAAALAGIADQRKNRPEQIVQDMEDVNQSTGTTNLFVYPLPDGVSDYTDGEYRVKVPYWRTYPDMVNDGDQNPATLDRNIAKFMLEWAMYLSFPMDWNDGRAEVWRQMAERTWVRIKSKEAGIALLGIDVLVPHMGADDPRVAR